MRTTQDERFAAAVGDELERRVRASRSRGATPVATRRSTWITAVASVAVLAIVAVVTAGLVGLHDGAGLFGPAACADGGTPIPEIGCGAYRVVGATDAGQKLGWADDDPFTVSFREQEQEAGFIEPDCAVVLPVGDVTSSTMTPTWQIDGQVACRSMPSPSSDRSVPYEQTRGAFMSAFLRLRLHYRMLDDGTLVLSAGARVLRLRTVSAVQCSDGGAAVAQFGCGDYRIVGATTSGKSVTWPTHPTLEFRSADGSLPEQGPGCSTFSLPVTATGSTLTAASTATKRIECPVTGGGEAAWMLDFWSRSVRFARELTHGQGPVYTLTSESKTLRIAQVAQALPTSSPAPSGTTAATGRGCAATSGGAPSRTAKGTMLVGIADVDGDGRPDQAWAQLGQGGMRIGVTTASGATVTRQVPTSATDPSLVIGARHGGVAPVLVGNGDGALVFAFVDCSIVPTLSSDSTQLRLGAGGSSGTGVGCSAGHLLRYAVSGAASSPTVQATRIDLSADGRSATVGTTSVVGRDLDPKAELITIAHAVTCEAVILHPAAYR